MTAFLCVHVTGVVYLYPSSDLFIFFPGMMNSIGLRISIFYLCFPLLSPSRSVCRSRDETLGVENQKHILSLNKVDIQNHKTIFCWVFLPFVWGFSGWFHWLIGFFVHSGFLILVWLCGFFFNLVAL